MRRRLAALLAGVFMLPQVVSGQTITPGSRVRFTYASEDTRTGTLVALTADTLEVRLVGRASSARMALARVTRLDVSRGKERHILAAGRMGLLVGAGVGAAVGAIDRCDASGTNCMSVYDGAMVGGIVLGVIGGGIGLLVGMKSGEKWERVALQRQRFGIVVPSRSHRGGVGLALSF